MNEIRDLTSFAWNVVDVPRQLVSLSLFVALLVHYRFAGVSCPLPPPTHPTRISRSRICAIHDRLSCCLLPLVFALRRLVCARKRAPTHAHWGVWGQCVWEWVGDKLAPAHVCKCERVSDQLPLFTGIGMCACESDVVKVFVSFWHSCCCCCFSVCFCSLQFWGESGRIAKWGGGAVGQQKHNGGDFIINF